MTTPAASAARDTSAASPPVPKASVLEIQRHVAEYYSLPIEAMTARCRLRSMTLPRQVAMYLARQMTGRSFPEIGDRFERDPATVMHAVRHVAARLETDPDLAAEVAALRDAVRLAA